MATRSQRRLTPEQRDARQREQLEQLRQATSALLTSEGWQRWLRARSRFHRYSLRNTLLIAFQCPHATHVAGFRSWLELGRCVRKGEKAIRIFAPISYRRQDDAYRTKEDERSEQLVGFKLAAVFDVSQTDPLPGLEPAPLDPPREPVSGDSHAHLLAPLERHAAELEFQVRYEPLQSRAGYCSKGEGSIVIDSELPVNGRVATLLHELAHAHGIDYTTLSRAEAELIVESVACIVCASVGLDTSGDSVPYLAGWIEHRAVERITQLAGTIDEIARAIEHAIDADTRALQATRTLSATSASNRERTQSWDAMIHEIRGGAGSERGAVHRRTRNRRSVDVVDDRPDQHEDRGADGRRRRSSDRYL